MAYSQSRTQVLSARECPDIRGVESSVGDMEKKNPLFWQMWDASFGRMLSAYVQRRTTRIIEGALNGKEMAQWETVEGRKRILSKARRNFGSKGRFSRIFDMRVPFLTKGSPIMQYFLGHVANAAALDVAYNVHEEFVCYGQRFSPDGYPPDWLARFHLSFPNAQAVRNRYRLVARLYGKIGGSGLSIACGSAQPIIHAFAMNPSADRLTLTDASADALELARKKVVQAEVAHRVSFVEVQWKELPSKMNDQKFHFVEACGIMDYLPHRSAVQLARIMLGLVEDGGSIVLSNVVPTRHKGALERMFNWEMIYRKPAELRDIIQEAGGRNICVETELWGIHAVATATR